MPHWRDLTDDDGLLYHHHLGGKRIDVVIERVDAVELVGLGGRRSRKPRLHFRGTQRAFAISKTDAKTLERLAGSGEIDRWIGLRITLCPATTRASDGDVPCIRISPRLPAQEAAPPTATTTTPDKETTDDDDA